MLASILWLYFPCCRAAYAQNEEMISKEIITSAETVRRAETHKVRFEAAQHLAKLTRDVDPQLVSDQALVQLIALLDTPYDYVRLWVAGALGNLGPRAKPAVPRLLTLLPKVDCLRGSVTSAPVIRTALTRIGVTPPPIPDCARGEGGALDPNPLKN